MWIAPAVALATAAYLLTVRPMALPAAAPVLLLWLAAPFVAFWISRPIGRLPAHLTDEQTSFLTSLARKTWLFIETYVTEKDNWLPPDNVQEYPANVRYCLEKIAEYTNVEILLEPPRTRNTVPKGEIDRQIFWESWAESGIKTILVVGSHLKKHQWAHH